MFKHQGRQGDRDGCVLVCGAGAAGMSAALAAARQGARVCLAERQSTIGGTVTHALIHTLGGLFDSAGEPVNGGLAVELIERLMQADPAVRRRRMGRTWVLGVPPETYRRVVRAWLEEGDRIEVLTDTAVVRVERDGDRVDEVELVGPRGPVRIRPKSVIDATGTADVAGLIDADLVRDDLLAAAGGFIFTLRNVAPGALAFPKGVGVVRALRAAADDGALPAGCGKAWVDTGVYDDEVYVKLFVALGERWREPERPGQIVRQALQEQAMVTELLRRLPGFGELVPGRTGSLGVRDGGRIEGDYRLTADDVRQGRRFEDAACRGCWPIEYWDPVEGVSIEHLPDDAGYDIPMRALKPRGLRNVWAAGKCLSADRLAQASARVVGTCWAMGEAVGRAAAVKSQEAAHEPVRCLS
jgi:glycine/D-amino acid oxidase-like deaminating enzyme